MTYIDARIILRSVLIIVALCTCACAQSSSLDLLLGIGDFEKCTFSRVSGIDEHGLVPSENLQIADGWTALTVNQLPESGTLDISTLDGHIFKLVNKTTFTDDGKAYLDSNKTYQYIGLQCSSEKSMVSQLATMVRSFSAYPNFTFQYGDKIVFQVDKIISSNFDPRNPPTVAIGVSNNSMLYETSQVDLSRGYATNVSCSLNILYPTYAYTYINIRLPKSTANGTPAILLTGAHLWIQRGNSVLADVEIPTVINRTIQTEKLCSNSLVSPARFLATNYDVVLANGWDHIYFPLMRKINPDIKIHLYQTAGAIESEDAVRWTISAFKIEDVAKYHPDWLYPQSNPSVKNDPSINPDLPDSPYIGKYLNINGLLYDYAIDVSNKQFQDEWAQIVIGKAQAIGADGVWIDECGRLTREKDGAQREMWQIQQFIHSVIPKLRAAGLESVFMSAVSNLDGSSSWNGTYPEVYYSPFWKPTSSLPESKGYTANAPENTPDVFFREYSFIKNNYGYDSSYWLKCIYDAQTVAAWNARLSTQLQKRIYYDVQQEDTDEHPAFNKESKAGWATFAFASFLLCKNDYVYFGAGHDMYNGHRYDDAGIDYSITQKLGVPDGNSTSINSNSYFRKRKYKSDGENSFGGIVVVNANTNRSLTFALPSDATDEDDRLYLSGTKIEFLPNMGKIFVYTSPHFTVSVVASTDSVTPGQTVDITVTYANNGTAEAKSVVIQANVPSELNYVSGSAEKTGGIYNKKTKTVSWTISKVAAGQSGTRTFKAVVK